MRNALELADALDAQLEAWAIDYGTVGDAATLLRTQHADLERKDALLRQALDVLNGAHGDGMDDEQKLAETYFAIRRELQ